MLSISNQALFRADAGLTSLGGQPRWPRLLATVLAVVALTIALALPILGAQPGQASAGRLMAPLPQDQPMGDVTVVIHSCPDGLVAAGFYQYGLHCTSEAHRYGVPLGLSSDGRPATFQYSQPETHAALKWHTAAGAITISEVISPRPRESVVFCSDRPAGNVVGTMDGTEIPVTNGKVSLTLTANDQLFCDWYRFPGGVTDDATSIDATPPASSASPAAPAILIRLWVCNLGSGHELFGPTDGPRATTVADQYNHPGARPSDYRPFPLPYQGDLAADSQELMTACSQAGRGFTFTLSGSSGSDAMMIGDQDAYIGWDQLNPGSYALAESLPSGSDQPVIYCDSAIAGQQTLRANVSQQDANDGGFSYNLKQDETLRCDWFNLTHAGLTISSATRRPFPSSNRSASPTGLPIPSVSRRPLPSANRSASPSPTATPSLTGSDAGSQSITISAMRCPDGMDFDTAVQNGECLDPVDGYTFVADGPNGYHSQSNTGDSLPGAVSFSGIDPGSYTLTATGGSAEAAVYCDGLNTPVTGGAVTIMVYPTNNVQCEWFLASDGSGSIPSSSDDTGNAPGPSPTPSSHNGNVQDNTNDTDDDGLLDVDETTIYQTDPNNADTDGDGIPDGDEVNIYGTDPNNPDSDGDGLTDGQEVYTYGTDPLNADTDGDGASDGHEVAVGSDPLDPHEIPVSQDPNTAVGHR